MTDNRESLLGKIRALMSKTTENGCSEAEAMAALDKARAMMDAYEVTAEDLQMTKEEKAVFRTEPPGSSDPHKIKSGLAMAVATFCECQVWRNAEKALTFCGMQSDARFATWLLDSLTQFAQSEIANFLMGNVTFGSDRKLAISSFAFGCTKRISERLNELSARSARVVTSSNGRALVVVKSQAVSAKMASEGITLRSSRSSRKSIDRDAFNAGKAAGERASFGRPVTGANATLRLR
jgi:hypothetical protein